MWLHKRVSGHSFAQCITSFIAFIYIHLDIYRIIIIIIIQIQTVASALRIRLRRKERKQIYASLCTKSREGVFRLRLKKYKFRPHQSSSYMEGKVKNILQGMDKFTKQHMILKLQYSLQG
jgi:hypothetical protein